MTKSTLAKVAGWLGAAISTLAASGSFGKYAVAAGAAGSALTAWGLHNASNTSAGHPNGAF
jgi:hypothetical protein